MYECFKLMSSNATKAWLEKAAAQHGQGTGDDSYRPPLPCNQAQYSKVLFVLQLNKRSKLGELGEIVLDPIDLAP